MFTLLIFDEHLLLCDLFSSINGVHTEWLVHECHKVLFAVFRILNITLQIVEFDGDQLPFKCAPSLPTD